MEGYKRGLLNTAIPAIAAFIFIGIVLGAGAIALSGMQTGLPTATLVQNYTIASMGNSSNGLVNFGLQLPTTGTIVGVSLIIMVLFVAIGAYVFGRK
jgi:LPXTG-motif cell wall-anchored protein